MTGLDFLLVITGLSLSLVGIGIFITLLRFGWPPVLISYIRQENDDSMNGRINLEVYHG